VQICVVHTSFTEFPISDGHQQQNAYNELTTSFICIWGGFMQAYCDKCAGRMWQGAGHRKKISSI